MAKKAMIMPWTFTITVPIIILSIVFLGLAIIVLAKLMSATINASTRSVNSDAALYAMLNSNDCAPNTNLKLSEIIGIGMGHGGGLFGLSYGGGKDGYVNLPPPADAPLFTVGSCVVDLAKSLELKTPWLFYVEYPGCPKGEYPNGVPKCFRTYGGGPMGNTDALTTESVGYVALPNGNVAKVVLLTSA